MIMPHMQDSTVNSECGVLHVACVGAISKRIAIAIAIVVKIGFFNNAIPYINGNNYSQSASSYIASISSGGTV
jgi:hypothetical protein